MDSSLPCVYDVTIVGGGIIGRSTAWKLKRAKPNFQILLIDQFPMSESHGSSKGRSKGIQKTHWVEETDTLRQMRIESLEEWISLKTKVSSRKMVREHEALFVGPADCSFMKYTLQSLRKYPGFETTEYISNAALRKKYPDINFSDGSVGILDASELCLAADEILKYILEEFETLGGITRKEEVVQITPKSDTDEIISISTKEKNVYRTEKIVIATGPWLIPMMQDYGIEKGLYRKHAMELYWKLDKEDIACPSLFEYKDNLMVWTNYTTEHEPCLKIGFPGKLISHTDLHDVKTMVDDNMIEKMTKYIKETFGRMVSSDSPVHTEHCVFTFTKDKKFIIGRDQGRKNIVLAVGMTGRGFGYSPAISNIVCDLVLGNEPKYDISEFDVARFK